MSHTELESRLAAAYRARAEQITETSLTARSEPDFALGHRVLAPRRSGRHARWVGPLLAAAAVATLAAGAVGVAHLADRRSAPPAASHTPTPAPTATGTMLARGREGSRADIPWSRVSDGWTLAVWNANPTAGAHAGGTLYLVNPQGGRYKITDLPDGSAVADWTSDGRRALIFGGDGSRTDLDLATGKRRAVAIRLGEHARYTADGTGLIVAAKLNIKAPVPVRQIGLDGTVQHVFPTSLRGVGRLETYDPAATVSSGPGGVVVFRADHGFAVFDQRSGALVALAPTPAGTDWCLPLRFIKQSFLAICAALGGPLDVWLFGQDGNVIQRLTTTAGGNGVSDAVQLNTHLLLQAVGCNGRFTVQEPDGTVRPGPAFATPAGATEGMAVVGFDLDVVTVLSNGDPSCISADTAGRVLFAGDTDRRTSTVLLGGSLNGGAVLQAFGFRGSR